MLRVQEWEYNNYYRLWEGRVRWSIVTTTECHYKTCTTRALSMPRPMGTVVFSNPHGRICVCVCVCLSIILLYLLVYLHVSTEERGYRAMKSLGSILISIIILYYIGIAQVADSTLVLS